MLIAAAFNLMTNYQPFFSIIIPTYDRPERLTACLQAIDRLVTACANSSGIIYSELTK